MLKEYFVNTNEISQAIMYVWKYIEVKITKFGDFIRKQKTSWQN